VDWTSIYLNEALNKWNCFGVSRWVQRIVSKVVYSMTISCPVSRDRRCWVLVPPDTTHINQVPRNAYPSFISELAPLILFDSVLVSNKNLHHCQQGGLHLRHIVTSLVLEVYHYFKISVSVIHNIFHMYLLCDYRVRRWDSFLHILSFHALLLSKG
jgi:hypothetical protein